MLLASEGGADEADTSDFTLSSMKLSALVEAEASVELSEKQASLSLGDDLAGTPFLGKIGDQALYLLCVSDKPENFTSRRFFGTSLDSCSNKFCSCNSCTAGVQSMKLVRCSVVGAGPFLLVGVGAGSFFLAGRGFHAKFIGLSSGTASRLVTSGRKDSPSPSSTDLKLLSMAVFVVLFHTEGSTSFTGIV